MASIKINGNAVEVGADVDPDMPLLWFLRDELDMIGAKFGCGSALCGACTVIQVKGGDRQAIRSCVSKISEFMDSDLEVVTIEGLGGEHPVQRIWEEEQVPQCGYCQTGQIMTAIALVDKIKDAPEVDVDDAIDRVMAGNLCRCGTYQRIRKAINRAVGR